MNPPNDPRRQVLTARLSVASRIGAAVLGGYALASAASSLLALSLPLSRHEAVLTGMMISFLFYALAVIWVFHARSATRAWIGMAAPTSVLVFMCWILIRVGGGA